MVYEINMLDFEKPLGDSFFDHFFTISAKRTWNYEGYDLIRYIEKRNIQLCQSPN